MSAVDTATTRVTGPAGAHRAAAKPRRAAWARRAPLLPALVFLIVITQLPFVATLIISFMNWNALYPDQIHFTGVANYRTVLTDSLLRASIVTTVELTVAVVLISLLPGLQSRPAEAMEAATVDGAGPWQTFRYLTLPHLRRYLELGALLGSIYVVQNFDSVFTITSGGLGTANLPYTIYQTFYQAHDYGRASAAGVVVVIATIIIATFALRVVSSLFREEAKR